MTTCRICTLESYFLDNNDVRMNVLLSVPDGDIVGLWAAGTVSYPVISGWASSFSNLRTFFNLVLSSVVPQLTEAHGLKPMPLSGTDYRECNLCLWR